MHSGEVIKTNGKTRPVVAVNNLIFTLELNTSRFPNLGKDALLRTLKGHMSHSIHQVAIIRESRQKLPTYQKWVYRLFVGKIPDLYHSILQVGMREDCAHLSYERADVTWEAKVSNDGAREKERRITFQLPNGDPYLVDASLCVPHDLAVRAIEEFASTGIRPKCVKWGKVG